MSSPTATIQEFIQWVIGQTILELLVYGILIILGGALAGYLGAIPKSKKWLFIFA